MAFFFTFKEILANIPVEVPAAVKHYSKDTQVCIYTCLSMYNETISM